MVVVNNATLTIVENVKITFMRERKWMSREQMKSDGSDLMKLRLSSFIILAGGEFIAGRIIFISFSWLLLQ